MGGRIRQAPLVTIQCWQEGRALPVPSFVPHPHHGGEHGGTSSSRGWLDGATSKVPVEMGTGCPVRDHTIPPCPAPHIPPRCPEPTLTIQFQHQAGIFVREMGGRLQQPPIFNVSPEKGPGGREPASSDQLRKSVPVTNIHGQRGGSRGGGAAGSAAAPEPAESKKLLRV